MDIEVEVADGLHVRGVGGDIPAGAEVLPVGTVLGPAHLGVAASVGCRRLTVFPPLRVGVLSTGDELVEGDATAATRSDTRVEPPDVARAGASRRLRTDRPRPRP